jgi:transposase
LLLLGVDYQQVLLFSCVKERTRRLWVSRYNELGVDGLIYRPQAGRPRKMEPPQVTSEIIPLLEDPSLAEQTHWTLTKLHGYLKVQKDIDLSYRTLHRYIKEQNYVRRIPRPMPEPPNKIAWQQSREECAQQLIQAFLDTFAQEVPEQEGKEIVLVLDNASWHKAKSLHWHHIKPFYRSAYSPDFNPIERLWQHIKSHHLADYITNKGNELEQKLFDVLQLLLEAPDTVQSICANRCYNGT